MENDSVLITYAHAKRLNYCSRGIRRFCSTYGINYLNFVKNGIESSKLKHINDPLVLELIKVAKNVNE